MSDEEEYGPYELLSDLDLNRAVTANSKAVVTFMFAACRGLVPALPPIVVDGLAEAHSFHFGATSAEALEKARVACWNFLGRTSSDFQDPVVCRVRAALCTMYPERDDPFDVLNNFLGFAIGGGVPEAEILVLMKQYLAASIGT